MKISLQSLILVFSVLITSTVYCQSPSESEKFPDGVYFSFQQLSSGKPGLEVGQLRNAHLKNVNPRQWFRSDSLF